MEWYNILMLILAIGWAFWGAHIFVGRPILELWGRKRREEEEGRKGFADPVAKAICKLLRMDMQEWEMVNEYELRHTSGVYIKHPNSAYPALLTWYFPGYGSPSYDLRKDGYRNELSYDQKQVLHAISLWKEWKALQLFGSVKKEAS